MADFEESEHPRDKDGKFTSKGDQSSSNYQQEVNNRIKWAKENNIDIPLTSDGAVDDLKLQEICDKSKNQNTYLHINDIEKELNSNSKNANEIFRKMIADNKVNLNISRQKQNRHIEGTFEHGKELENGIEKSLLTADAKELIKQHAGKGKLYFKLGKWQHKEIFRHDNNIGIYINKKYNQKHSTNKGYIHYSNSGVHIVPHKKDKEK